MRADEITEIPAAPLGASTWGLTVVFAVLVIGVAALIAFGGEPSALANVGAGVLLALLPASWAFAPKGYAVAPGRLVVRRRGMPSLTYVTTPDAPQAWQLRGVRVFAVGGFFGHFGTFWSSELGWFKAHVTDRRRAVLVETTRRPVLISPADPERFAAALAA